LFQTFFHTEGRDRPILQFGGDLFQISRPIFHQLSDNQRYAVVSLPGVTPNPLVFKYQSFHGHFTVVLPQHPDYQRDFIASLPVQQLSRTRVTDPNLINDYLTTLDAEIPSMMRLAMLEIQNLNLPSVMTDILNSCEKIIRPPHRLISEGLYIRWCQAANYSPAMCTAYRGRTIVPEPNPFSQPGTHRTEDGFEVTIPRNISQ
jgi:hypothetical protein